MTPDKHTKATQLEQKHRQLQLELRAWQQQAEPPAIFNAQPIPTTAVPINLWLALKAGMVKHLQELIAANRKSFEEL